MTTTTPWIDTPPSEKNVEFWVQHRRTGKQSIGKSISFREWLIDGEEEFMPERYYQFGPRVLSAEETVSLTAEVERLRAENAALRERLTVDDLDELERYTPLLDGEWKSSTNAPPNFGHGD